MTEYAKLIEELVERLREEGAPTGTWLVDLTSVRRDLRAAFERTDALLQDLQEALLSQHEQRAGIDQDPMG